MNNNFVFYNRVWGCFYSHVWGCFSNHVWGLFYNRVWDCFSLLVMQPKWYLDVVTITYPRSNPN